jgi:hypothetical protein
VELEPGVHAGDDQFGVAVKRPVGLPRRLPHTGIPGAIEVLKRAVQHSGPIRTLRTALQA